jgi:hypothetical protein
LVGDRLVFRVGSGVGELTPEGKNAFSGVNVAVTTTYWGAFSTHPVRNKSSSTATTILRISL